MADRRRRRPSKRRYVKRWRSQALGGLRVGEGGGGCSSGGERPAREREREVEVEKETGVTSLGEGAQKEQIAVLEGEVAEAVRWRRILEVCGPACLGVAGGGAHVELSWHERCWQQRHALLLGASTARALVVLVCR